MIYLASLYSNGVNSDSTVDTVVRQLRYEYTSKRLVEFMNSGEFVFSPIVHCHEISTKYRLPKTYEFWKNNDRHFISRSDKVYVLMMKDKHGSWKKSEGITDEINFAKSIGVQVEYIDCEDYNED